MLDKAEMHKAKMPCVSFLLVVSLHPSSVSHSLASPISCLQSMQSFCLVTGQENLTS
jgi:hypothetical protein